MNGKWFFHYRNQSKWGTNCCVWHVGYRNKYFGHGFLSLIFHIYTIIGCKICQLSLKENGCDILYWCIHHTLSETHDQGLQNRRREFNLTRKRVKFFYTAFECEKAAKIRLEMTTSTDSKRIPVSYLPNLSVNWRQKCL